MTCERAFPCGGVLETREARVPGAVSHARTQVVALGHCLGPDPLRVALKRCVLSGLPLRAHKRKAVIKQMFYNPEDVAYFKPAQLVTKHGITANILEPIGTHGHFKIALSRPMTQADTVLLALYKRAYPKFAAADEAAEDVRVL